MEQQGLVEYCDSGHPGHAFHYAFFDEAQHCLAFEVPLDYIKDLLLSNVDALHLLIAMLLHDFASRNVDVPILHC